MGLDYPAGVSAYPEGVPAENLAWRDAFGRWRISAPWTLFDSKQSIDADPYHWDDAEVSGGSTSSTHSTTEARSRLAVGATTAGVRVRQTYRRFNYVPGKSHLVIMTALVDAAGGGTGITRSLGLFDDNNGLFFLDDEGTFKVVVRDGGSDTEVAQSSWNIDPMDGTGPSGKTLDLTKVQIFTIDFEWLGVGRVRFGVDIDGVLYYVHESLTANSGTTVYMATANLPLRYRIENDGTGAASSFDAICATVQSEGGIDPIGQPFWLSNASTGVTGTSAGTVYALKGIQLKTTTLSQVIRFTKIDTVTTSNKAYEWLLYLNPTVAGTFTFSDFSGSRFQTATGVAANTITGGTILDGGYVYEGGSSVVPVNAEIRLGADISGTRDQIVLAFRPISNDTTVYGGMQVVQQ